MKLLLDENLPKRLAQDYADHEVYTVRQKQWNGIKNGALLQLMITEGFDALLTFDKNLQYQQNFSRYTITVIILSASINTYQSLSSLTPQVQQLLNAAPLPIGPIVIKT